MGKQALVIEDHHDLANIYSQALQDAGYEIRTATSGTEALRLLQTWIPDVIVLDLHLPGASGMNILDYTAFESKFSETQIVIVTADAQQADALRDRATLVLVKPVSYAQLRDLTSRLS